MQPLPAVERDWEAKNDPAHAACSTAEGEFMAGEASSRWRVLALVAGFDCAMFVVRAVAKVVSGTAIGASLVAQLANMALLYALTALLNARSRRLGSRAAHQVGEMQAPVPQLWRLQALAASRTAGVARRRGGPSHVTVWPLTRALVLGCPGMGLVPATHAPASVAAAVAWLVVVILPELDFAAPAGTVAGGRILQRVHSPRHSAL